jgi:hypothetical protein
LFPKDNAQQAAVKSVLDHYEHSTGQLVSLGKCSIMYGSRVTVEDQVEVKKILKYMTESFKEKYIGLLVPEEWKVQINQREISKER